MSVSAKTDVRFFWQTDDAAGMSELRSVNCIAEPGPLTTYQVPLLATPHWRGMITRLRLDPGNSPGIDVAVESIELQQ